MEKVLFLHTLTILNFVGDQLQGPGAIDEEKACHKKNTLCDALEQGNVTEALCDTPLNVKLTHFP